MAGQISSGRLEEVSFAEAAGALFQGQKTGVLTVTAGDRSRKVYFYQGNPVAVSSADPRDHLARILAAKGKISPEDAERLKEVGETKEDLQAVDYVSKENLTWGLKFRFVNLCYDLFRWSEGTFDFEEAPPPKNLFLMKVPTPTLLSKGVKHIPPLTLMEKVPDGHSLAPGEAAAAAAPPLGEEEMAVLGECLPGVSVEKVLEGAGRDPASTREILFILLSLGQIAFETPAEGALEAVPSVPLEEGPEPMPFEEEPPVPAIEMEEPAPAFAAEPPAPAIEMEEPAPAFEPEAPAPAIEMEEPEPAGGFEIERHSYDEEPPPAEAAPPALEEQSPPPAVPELDLEAAPAPETAAPPPIEEPPGLDLESPEPAAPQEDFGLIDTGPPPGEPAGMEAPGLDMPAPEMGLGEPPPLESTPELDMGGPGEELGAPPEDFGLIDPGGAPREEGLDELDGGGLEMPEAPAADLPPPPWQTEAPGGDGGAPDEMDAGEGEDGRSPFASPEEPASPRPPRPAPARKAAKAGKGFSFPLRAVVIVVVVLAAALVGGGLLIKGPEMSREPILDPIPGPDDIPKADIVSADLPVSRIPTLEPKPAPPKPAAPAPSEPSPAAPRERPDLYASGLGEFKAGNHNAAAVTWKSMLRQTGAAYTVSVVVACQIETVKSAFARYGEDRKPFVLPLRLSDGRSCYRVCFGTFTSEEEALSAISSLPPTLQTDLSARSLKGLL